MFDNRTALVRVFTYARAVSHLEVRRELSFYTAA